MSSGRSAVLRLLSLLLVVTSLSLGLGVSALAAPVKAGKAVKVDRGDTDRAHAAGIDPNAPVDAVIKGLVYDSTGQLRDNILVEAFSVDDPSGAPVASDFTYEYGDSATHGAFELHVPAGDFLVRYSSQEYARFPFATTFYGGGAGTTVTVAATETVTLDPMTLARETGAPVTGTVLKADGTPFKNVRVTLVRRYSNGYHSYLRSTFTDATGTYRFERVMRGRSFTINVDGGHTKNGRHLHWNDVFLGNAPTASTADAFTIPSGDAGATLDPITLSNLGATITGTVAVPDGILDYADVEILARRPGTTAFDHVAYVGASSSTSSSAPFTAKGIKPGYEYTVRVYTYGDDSVGRSFYLGDTFTAADAETVTPTDNGSYDVGTISYGAGTTVVTLPVTGPDGPLDSDDVDVDVYVAPTEDYDYETSFSARYHAASGLFRFRIEPGVEHTIGVYDYEVGRYTYLGGGRDLVAAERFSSAPGQDLLELPAFDLGAGTAPAVLEVETPAGVPLADVLEVYADAYQLTEDGWQYYSNLRNRPDGTLRTRLPIGGTFTFRVEYYDLNSDYNVVYLGGADSFDGATTFESVADGTSNTLVIAESLPGVVTGTVLGEGDLPLEGAEVQLWGQYAADCADCWETVSYAETDADGHYRFVARSWWDDYTALTVAASAPDGYEYAFVGGAMSAGEATAYPLPSVDQTVQVDALTLQLASGLLRGRIIAPGVDLENNSGYAQLYRWYDYGDGTGYFEYYAYSGFYGRDGYTFTGIPEGSYALEVYSYGAEAAGYIRSAWFGGAGRPMDLSSPGVITVVGEGPTDGVDVELEQGVVLSGTVTSENGLPVPDAYVYAYPWNGGDAPDYSPSYYGYTEEDGRYRMLVPVGSELFVQAYRNGYEDFQLGGENPFDTYPGQSETNSLTVAEDTAFDIEMAVDWGLVGSGPTTQADYCLQETSSRATFAGRELAIGYDGTIALRNGRGHRGYDRAFPLLGADSRDPVIVPGVGYADSRTWGVSPDGQTLCVLVNSEAYDDGEGGLVAYSPVYQLFLTATETGFEVTHNVETVPYSSSDDQVGYSNGEGASGTTLFPGGGVENGYADSNAETGLANGSNVEPAVPGRYVYEVDGFVRGAAPVALTKPAVLSDGTPTVGEELGITPGTWTVDGVEAEVEEYYFWKTFSSTRYRNDCKRGSEVARGVETYTPTVADAGRYLCLMVRAWTPGHGYTYKSSKAVKVLTGTPVGVNDVAPTITSDPLALGETTIVDTGEWTWADGLAPESVVYRYRFYRDGEKIDRQNRSARREGRYLVRRADIGRELSVKVKAFADGFDRVEVTSPGREVADLLPVPMIEAPVLSGVTQVGQPLSVTPGSWGTEESPVTPSISWAVDSEFRAADPDTNGLVFTPVLRDRFGYVTVTVTATAPGFRRAVYTKTVGPIADGEVDLAPLTISVVGGDPAAPVTEAYVYACEYETYTCLPGDSVDSNGQFSGQGVRGAEYYIYVYPTGTGFREASTTYVMPSTGDGAVTLTLPAIVPPPPNVTLPGNMSGEGEEPTVYYGDPQEFIVTGCAATENPTYTVTIADGGAPITGAMTLQEGVVDGIGTFKAVIAPFSPRHGAATISTNIPADCAEGTEPTEVNIYIDPSGVVTDQFGRPIQGASVTLLRADTVVGPFTAVPDGSDIMSEDNRANPSLTDSTGYFRWDVVEGWYKVRAEATGCTQVVTPAMQVLPARVDLLIKMTCDVTAPTGTAAITGTPKVGQTLSTVTTSWPADLAVGVQWLRDGEPITGATGLTYDVVPADVGTDITVRHDATRANYLQEEGRGAPVVFDPIPAVTSTAVEILPGDAPTATGGVIAGTGKVGTELTATDPTWSLTEVVTTRQWTVDGVPVEGATGPLYTVQAADVGKPVTVVFTGTKAGFADGTSTPTAVTALLGDPATGTGAAITGVAKVGGTLTAVDPTWSGTGWTTSRQWTVDGTPVAGATGATYEVLATDVGKAISVAFTGTKAGHTDASAAPEAAVTGLLGDAPTATGGAVAGSGKVGTDLTATDPTWSLAGVSTTRQWTVDGAPVAGATGATFTVRAADVGKPVTVVFTGTKAGFADGTSTPTAVTALLGDAATNTTAPAITGSAVPGQVVSVSDGAWSVEGLAFTYQWFLDGTLIESATASSYTVAVGDVGGVLTAQVTAARTGFAAGTAEAAGVEVAKLVSAIKVKAKPKKLTTKGGKLLVTVSVPGLVPDGKVALKDGKKKIGKPVKLKKGKAVFTVKKLKPGKHSFVVTYSGSPAIDKAVSKPLKVTIKK